MLPKTNSSNRHFHCLKPCLFSVCCRYHVCIQLLIHQKLPTHPPGVPKYTTGSTCTRLDPPTHNLSLPPFTLYLSPPGPSSCGSCVIGRWFQFSLCVSPTSLTTCLATLAQTATSGPLQPHGCCSRASALPTPAPRPDSCHSCPHPPSPSPSTCCQPPLPQLHCAAGGGYWATRAPTGAFRRACGRAVCLLGAAVASGSCGRSASPRCSGRCARSCPFQARPVTVAP